MLCKEAIHKNCIIKLQNQILSAILPPMLLLAQVGLIAESAITLNSQFLKDHYTSELT